MPRPRVKDEDRKRVARACDTCKRRKEKCDGSYPCLLCKRRNREDECHYADGQRRRSSNRKSVDAQPADPAPNEERNHVRMNSNDAEIAIESLLTLSGTRSAPKSPVSAVSPRAVTSHAPVPKLARLLKDGHGKFVFVGDSSTLAFLQNIRRLVKMAVGDCDLTLDPKRHAMVEAIPPEKSPGSRDQQAYNKPTRQEAKDFVTSYFAAASGIIDLFDQGDIMQHLLAWAEDSIPSNSATNSIFYLVLAIGAQNGPTANEEQAASYFRRGRELAVSSFMDDPSVLTVQSYVLIAFYMLTTCRRNGAFMLLGIAIRAAYALGLHRSDISVLFETRERYTRERVWKSLRILDMFMSASLGRPPATSEVDGGNVAWEGTSRGYEDVRLQALHSSALLRICFIFERVLNEVYCRREVSVQLVDSISRQYRDWNLGLETGLQMDGLIEGESGEASDLQQTAGLAHVKGAYYWSIILLTRPFLIFDVSTKLKASTGDGIEQKTNDTTTLSEACIDAALRSIEIGSDLIHTPGCARRPFMVINSMFVSALVVGLAMFGDYDKSFPLLSSLDQARLVLRVLAQFDPSARRFFLITTYLQQAAQEHLRRRDEKQLQKRRKEIHDIFGDLAHRATSNGAGQGSFTPPVASASTSDNMVSEFQQSNEGDMGWIARLEDDFNKRGPILTTSGALASSNRVQQNEEEVEATHSVTHQRVSGIISPDGDMPSVPSYNDDFPLLSLMDEFDGIDDPFLEFL